MSETKNTDTSKILRGHQVEVIDLKTNNIQLFITNTDAAKFFELHTRSIYQIEKRGTKPPYRGRYIIKFIKKP